MLASVFCDEGKVHHERRLASSKRPLIVYDLGPAISICGFKFFITSSNISKLLRMLLMSTKMYNMSGLGEAADLYSCTTIISLMSDCQ